MATSNQEQIDYWNGEAGTTWVEAQERLDGLLAPISAELIERAAVTDADRVLDIGCGCGQTSIELARRGATVWGIDISGPMLARARQRAANAERVRFSLLDAASADFAPEHTLLFSRFGVMFFADPIAAFSNLHGALVADGRLCFVCWQAPRENPWMAVAGRAVQPFLPVPEVEPDPRAPGPFAFAEPDYVRDILTRAGFSSIELQSIHPTLHVADTLDEAIEFQGRVGPVARALAELQGEARQAALAAAREALSGHMTEAGLDLAAACWIVTARP
ncbi:MAG: methyltransferase domain-containing protein [Gammaproteobacteria bacterium]|nr:methyltransferase domain-containing protein [Gammaproteobacteria bacterium]